MSEFQILNERRYPIKTIGSYNTGIMPTWNTKKLTDYKDLLPFWRFEHRVTLGWNTREFMVFIDQVKQSIYIEEISGGHLETVADDNLFESLLRFAQNKGFCDIMPPLMKPSSERFV